MPQIKIIMKHISFQKLISANCDDILKIVLGGMEKQYFKVGSGKIPIPNDKPTPILYRWWFHEDSIVLKKLCEISKTDNELDKLLNHVEKHKFKDDGPTYYALYFGKSNNGYKRLNNHVKGNTTLGNTLEGLLNVETDEITNILKECYVQWYPFDKEQLGWIGCVETLCIALGKYPLNIDDNPYISDEQAKEHYKREKRY